jgi:DNA-binding MarR family transcriptional regulator
VDERERIIREVIKVLPELANSLNRDVALHAVAGVASGGTRVGAAQAGTAGAGAAKALSTAQVRALVHLAQYGSQTMGELAEGMQITTASATGLIKPLVALGHVARARDPNDERVVRVTLSERAQGMADQILAERRREVEAALIGMDDAACRSFLEGLERLVGRRR